MKILRFLNAKRVNVSIHYLVLNSYCLKLNFFSAVPTTRRISKIRIYTMYNISSYTCKLKLINAGDFKFLWNRL